jgi:phosphohistidine phosphatase
MAASVSTSKESPMKLLVIRHAIAEERAEFALTGKPDDLRPLTARGARRMRRNAARLRRLVPRIDLLASSPLARARQTAEIVAKVYGKTPLQIIEELSPDHELPSFVHWLRTRSAGSEVVAAVGHEPHLSHLVSWLLAGHFTSFVELKKGAACLLEFAGEAGPAEARLLWLLQPRQLRRLRK